MSLSSKDVLKEFLTVSHGTKETRWKKVLNAKKNNEQRNSKYVSKFKHILIGVPGWLSGLSVCVWFRS